MGLRRSRRLRSRLERSAVSQLLVEMPEGASPEVAQENLRRALHDPTLELAYWLPEHGGYVDVYGRALTLPADSPERAVTPVEYENRPVAALIHDPTLLEESELVGAVVAAARVTIERDRLQADLRAKLDELQRERDFVRDVVNAAPSYFVVVQPDGRIVRFNDTLAAASGVRDDESARGEPFWDVFVSSEDADELRAWFSAVAAGGEAGEHEARMNGAEQELITAWTLAIGQRLNIRVFAGIVVPYPTFTEIGKRAAMSFFAPRLTSLWVRRILGWLQRFG